MSRATPTARRCNSSVWRQSTMKRQIAFATALAASMAIGTAAQTQTTTPGPATTGANGGQMVTVTGCVTSPASSAAGAATAMPSFVLSNPTMGSAGSPGAPGMTGATGSSSM